MAVHSPAWATHSPAPAWATHPPAEAWAITFQQMLQVLFDTLFHEGKDGVRLRDLVSK